MKFSLSSILQKVEALEAKASCTDESKDVLCTLGLTGAGKSSLICYSLDYSALSFDKQRQKYDIKHEKGV